MKETKVYAVKRPSGSFDWYQEPIEKIFFDKDKANNYIKEENSKLPLEQTKKCNHCPFRPDGSTHWDIQEKQKPECADLDKYKACKNYYKYWDFQPLFIEEHDIADIKTHDRELVKEVCEKIRNKIDHVSMHTATKERLMLMCKEIQKEYEK